MPKQDDIAVIGAGVIGAAIACALAREGRKVWLLDRAEPGATSASFGNVGHIAAELVQPLPSTELLFGFWKELAAFDGALVLPAARRFVSFLPWGAGFAIAAFRRDVNTSSLAPLVKPAAATLKRWMSEIGRPDLLRRNGHYEIWTSARSRALADAQAQVMARLGVRTEPAPQALVEAAQQAAKAPAAAGLWFPDSAHVLDPFEIVRAFVTAAIQSGATVRRVNVRALRPRGGSIEVLGDADAKFEFNTVVVSAGVWSAPLLAPFGLRAPLESVRGYHIELPGQPPLAEAPVLHVEPHVLVTPMAGRLRASSFMEFKDPGAPPDPRLPARLREKVRALGYPCAASGPSWVGPRPVLPDYLPGIGRAPGPHNLFYAIGHQHIGLTIAPVTAELVADLVARRTPRHDLTAFDLRRFGSPGQAAAEAGRARA